MNIWEEKIVSLLRSVRLNGAITQGTHYESWAMFFLRQFTRVEEQVKLYFYVDLFNLCFRTGDGEL